MSFLLRYLCFAKNFLLIFALLHPKSFNIVSLSSQYTFGSKGSICVSYTYEVSIFLFFLILLFQNSLSCVKNIWGYWHFLERLDLLHNELYPREYFLCLWEECVYFCFWVESFVCVFSGPIYEDNIEILWELLKYFNSKRLQYALFRKFIWKSNLWR